MKTTKTRVAARTWDLSTEATCPNPRTTRLYKLDHPLIQITSAEWNSVDRDIAPESWRLFCVWPCWAWWRPPARSPTAGGLAGPTGVTTTTVTPVTITVFTGSTTTDTTQPGCTASPTSTTANMLVSERFPSDLQFLFFLAGIFPFLLLKISRRFMLGKESSESRFCAS